MAKVMPKPVVGIQTGASNAMHRDLSVKFAADVKDLVERSIGIMRLALSVGETVDIVLSVLASTGLRVEEIAGCPPRTFEAIVEVAAKHRGERHER